MVFFYLSLSIVPWHVGEVFDSLDDRCAYWDTLPKSIVNEHLPIGDIKVRDNDVFYMTKEWRNAIKAKRYQVPSKYRKLWRSSTLVKPQDMTRLTQEYLKSEAENYSTIA